MPGLSESRPAKLAVQEPEKAHRVSGRLEIMSSSKHAKTAKFNVHPRGAAAWRAICLSLSL
jgi:hypothetical protein